MYLYVSFIIVWLITFYLFWSKEAIQKSNVSPREFPNAFLNGLHEHAHIFPLKHFVDNDEDLTKKGESIRLRLQQSGLHKLYSVRSYMALSFLIFVGLMVTGVLFYFLLQFSDVGAKYILGVEMDRSKEGFDLRQFTLIMMMFMLLALMPNMYLKNLAKKHVVIQAKELPMLQMFTILMLRSGKTVSEIVFALSKLHTSHKAVFQKGYRIYVRNPEEAMEYLRTSFEGSRFADMFDLLEDLSMYAREETIAILENSMKTLVDETNDVKRKNDLTRHVYSQTSMIAPFAGLLLLGVMPLLMFAIQLFASATSMTM